MPGPAPTERKHGRTPNSLSSGDWREYDDVPFTGAPPTPKPPGRRKDWHPMAKRMWETASVMPHCKDWRGEEWLALEVLLYEIDSYYMTAPSKRKTAQLTEIRKQQNALGIGEVGRKERKILYKQRVVPGLPGVGPDDSQEVVYDGRPRPAGNVVPIKDRKKAILSRAKPGEGQGETAAG